MIGNWRFTLVSSVLFSFQYVLLFARILFNLQFFSFFFMIIHCICCNFFNTEFHWNKLNFISLPYSQRMRFLKKYFNTELESLYLLFLSKYEYSNTTLEWLKINFNNRALVHLGNGIWGRLRYTAPMLLGLSVTPADKGCVRQ